LLETEQILGSGDQQLGVVAHIANRAVAGATEQRSDDFCFVIVIDRQFLKSSISDARLRLLADRTDAVLFLEHLGISFDRDSILRVEMILASIRDAGVRDALCGDSPILFAAIVELFRRQILALQLIGLMNAGATGAVPENSDLSFDMTLGTERLNDVRSWQSFGVAFPLVLPIFLSLFIGSLSPRLPSSDSTALTAKAAFQSAYDVFVMAVLAQIWFDVFHKCQSIIGTVLLNSRDRMKSPNAARASISKS
jgi:hypothetical protein